MVQLGFCLLARQHGVNMCHCHGLSAMISILVCQLMINRGLGLSLGVNVDPSCSAVNR